MNTKEMIEVMQAHAEGKTIEARRNGTVTTTVCTRDWSECPTPVWDWLNVQYRIAPEPKKEGRWERVPVIRNASNDYAIMTGTCGGMITLDALPRIPGFGGIDYQSPFDPDVIVRSMAPVMFKSKEGKCYVTAGDYCDDEVMLFDQTDRPGIPVAAWFWREVKAEGRQR